MEEYKFQHLSARYEQPADLPPERPRRKNFEIVPCALPLQALPDRNPGWHFLPGAAFNLLGYEIPHDGGVVDVARGGVDINLQYAHFHAI
jgi:hypothetical protein